MHISVLDRTAREGRTSYYDAAAKVILFLSCRLDESLTLSRIAEAAATSRFHFNRRFRQVTGIPPCRFLYAMRLAKAKALLLTTRLKVIDVCYDVGYNSLGTFTSRFTEMVGVSPSRFRSQAKRLREQSVIRYEDSSKLDPRAASFTLTGTVKAPDNFQGFIFVALFSDPIPQGRPVKCTILETGGAYHLNGLSEGSFYLFALAITKPLDAKSLFHSPTALRAGGQRITVSNSRTNGSTELVLRVPEPVDPPILVALHPMMVQRRDSVSDPATSQARQPVAQQSARAN